MSCKYSVLLHGTECKLKWQHNSELVGKQRTMSSVLWPEMLGKEGQRLTFCDAPFLLGQQPYPAIRMLPSTWQQEWPCCMADLRVTVTVTSVDDTSPWHHPSSILPPFPPTLTPFLLSSFCSSILQLNNLLSSYCVRHCSSGEGGKTAVNTTQ